MAALPAPTSLARRLTPIAFALAGFLLLAFPTGIAYGLWRAPLESGAAWIWLVAWWAGCFAAHNRWSPRITRIIWLAILLMALAKTILYFLAPEQGVWARMTTARLRAWSGAALPVTREQATAPRPQKAEGWQLHRDARIPPHFINDHRRFNYYADAPYDRFRLPYRLEMQGDLVLPGNGLSVIAPAGRARLGGDPIPPGTPIPILVDNNLRKNRLTLILDTATTTAIPERIIETGQAGATPLPAWSWISGDSPTLNRSKARSLYMLSAAWNTALFPLLSLLWLPAWVSIASLKTTSRFLPLAILLIPVFAIAAPIQRDSALYFRAIAGLATLVTSLAITLPSLLKAKKRSRFLALISPIASESRASTAWPVVCLLIVAWTTLGSRFLESRFPLGFAILPAGIDSLFHYTYAREILAGDWWHRADAPFSRQAFIRYLLLLPLWLEGEGAAWGFHVHWTLYACIGACIWRVVAFRNTAAAWIALGLWLLTFPINDFKTWVPTLFPETWATLFWIASLLTLVFYHANASVRPILLLTIAGILLAVASWTRNNLILAAPFFLLAILLHANRRYTRRIAIQHAVAFTAATTACVLLISARNAALAPHASFTLFMTPGDSSVALFQGFLPPEIDPAAVASHPLTRALGPDAARFFEGIRQIPGRFAAYQLDRLLILFGLPAFSEPRLVHDYPRFNPFHLALWLAILGRIALYRRRAFAFPELLCWGAVISQLALLVFTGYIPTGYRLLTPIYPFLFVLALNGPAFPQTKIEPSRAAPLP